MLITIPDVLTADQVAQARKALDQAEWVDGRVTAGHQSAKAKDNAQVPESHPVARQLGEMILAALGKNALFMAAALPARVFPPLFNRYSGGQSFGTHVDNAIRQITGTPHRIRTDLSATLFLVRPRSMTAASCAWKTLMESKRLSFRRDTWFFILRRVCIMCGR